jgi:protocatechuate 3,4-dioxygenase alpha subunit
MSAGKRLGQTPSQTVGPFFAYALTPVQYGYRFASLAGPVMEGAARGPLIAIEGRVLDGEGQPVTDALIEVVQRRHGSSDAGKDGGGSALGRCGTGALDGGLFRFETDMPEAAEGEAPHLDLIVTMRGLLNHVFTRLYFAGHPANDADPVLLQVPAERRATLLATEAAPGLFRFDIRMQGDAETVFFDL